MGENSKQKDRHYEARARPTGGENFEVVGKRRRDMTSASNDMWHAMETTIVTTVAKSLKLMATKSQWSK
jgi:hypothetical protein